MMLDRDAPEAAKLFTNFTNRIESNEAVTFARNLTIEVEALCNNRNDRVSHSSDITERLNSVKPVSVRSAADRFLDSASNIKRR